MNPTTKTTPKDFFLHLGATIALYASAIALINLSFSVINYYFPDALAGYFSSGSIAWPISMLVVLVPILYVLEWYIKKDLLASPEKKDLWVRKWRIYLTLFLTGIVIVGDLVTLINIYLNGEVTVRFIYKVLMVILVTGAIFKYYFFSINENMKWANLEKKIIPWFGIVITILVIVFGFLAVGSPGKQRALRFDNQRVNDLQNIQWQIVNYWQQKGSLPASLEVLNDSIAGSRIPLDPENKTAYEYSTSTKYKFELCSTFSLKYEDMKGKGEFGGYGYGSSIDMAYPSVYPSIGFVDENWKHEAGRVCFERTIDPERYPINKPVPVDAPPIK